eukprot:TCONS_00040191-protein
MAVKERFHSSQDLRSADFYKNMDILPNGQAQRTLEDNFTTLIARSIVSYLPAFKSFSKHVPKHLKHQLTHEMSKKSEVVPLGLIFRQETVNAEMIQIMQEMQKYVPKLYNDDKSVKDIVEPIPFGGDQLTVERATNCKVAM